MDSITAYAMQHPFDNSRWYLSNAKPPYFVGYIPRYLGLDLKWHSQMRPGLGYYFDSLDQLKQFCRDNNVILPD